MTHGNAALNLTDELDYLFADEYPDQDYLDDNWIDIARQQRQSALTARRVALNFDDELQREIDQKLEADEQMVALEDDDLLDLSLAIDEDDLVDLRTLQDRPLY